MQSEALKELALNIKRLKTEAQTIELKAATKGCPTRLFDSLSSFSNQDDGGIIIFGIDENNSYAIKGVYDPQDLQKKSLSNASKWTLLFVPCLLFVKLTARPLFQLKFPE